jgi:hypothetical protein
MIKDDILKVQVSFCFASDFAGNLISSHPASLLQLSFSFANKFFFVLFVPRPAC